MKNRLIVICALLILLLSACGKKPLAETLPVETMQYEQENSDSVETNDATESLEQEEGILVWEDSPQETAPAATQPKQPIKPTKPNTPAETVPKQDNDTTEPTATEKEPESTETTKPTEKPAPTEVTEPVEEPTETTEPAEPPTEATKPSEEEKPDSGNTSPEWTPPIL